MGPLLVDKDRRVYKNEKDWRKQSRRVSVKSKTEIGKFARCTKGGKKAMVGRIVVRTILVARPFFYCYLLCFV